jgi:hypothetical protein
MATSDLHSSATNCGTDNRLPTQTCLFPFLCTPDKDLWSFGGKGAPFKPVFYILQKGIIPFQKKVHHTLLVFFSPFFFFPPLFGSERHILLFSLLLLRQVGLRRKKCSFPKREMTAFLSIKDCSVARQF